MEVGVCLIFILSLVLATNGQVWEEPYFLEGPHTEDVQFSESLPSGQIIYMNEELDYKPIIAKINYKGNETPMIGIFTVGSQVYLKPEIKKENDEWVIYINEKQDYENLVMQRYTFEINIKGFDSKKIFLNIINIDDNPPIIEYSTCEIPELYVGLSNCTYKVTDADGEISISVMKFKIYGPEENTFKIVEEKFVERPDYMEITLETKVELDFYENQLHSFRLEAIDSAENTGSITAIVQVIDMPNRDPVWTNIFATKTFDEKTKQTFTVKAIDGDTQINQIIKYRLVTDYTFLSINDDGIINVDEIDRDAEKNEIFTFNISAYKANNESWETPVTVVFIVRDINDHMPVFEVDEFRKEILEETYVPLDFEIFVEDVDLAENAQYDVKLVGIKPPDADAAFILIPNEGYQKQKFQLAIVNASLLDYEVEEWQNIELEIVATEKYEPTHVGKAKVFIDLINWNDEEPIFLEEKYTAEFLETEGKDFFVKKVFAEDRDIGDRVVHSIVGDTYDYLEINENTGDIKVVKDDAFDYNRQKEIIVQIKATDTLNTISEPFHSKYTQLIIQLIEVNNKQPELRMPVDTPNVKENEPEGFLITDEIIGTDVGTYAVLEFEIDWSNSFATKQSRKVNEEHYKECVWIKTEYANPEIKRNAIGHIIVKEIKPGVTIDFEEFDFLSLSIKLIDRNQTIGINTARGTLTVTIEDVNDNPPVWQEGSLEAERVVREAAMKGIPVGTVVATDIDGPLYNNIRYFMNPVNNTPDDLISIHPKTGQLEVISDKIDADLPPRYSLYYNVVATDCPEDATEDDVCYETPGALEIQILDTNNKYPGALTDEFKTEVYIYENETTGFEIVTLISEDLDRDEFYHQISHSINYKEHPDLRNYFAISEDGVLKVQLENDHELDRDGDQPTHTVYIVLQDNFLQEGTDRNKNLNYTEISIILLDVNDNPPVLPPSTEYNFIISENAKKSEKLKPTIIAPDVDEPNTDNSRVQYEVLGLKPTGDTPHENVDQLFDILSPDNKTGVLITNSELKGFWGTYDIHIKAFDLGDPPLSTNETYPLKITAYNYHDPKFIFPTKDTIRLMKERADVGKDLYYTNGKVLDFISATDEDGLEAGEVEFFIVKANEADDSKEYFDIENLGNNEGKLKLLKDINDRTNFQVTIEARDKGTDPQVRTATILAKILFLPTQGSPFFKSENFSTKFTEFEGGMKEIIQLPLAEDPKNGEDCTIDCHEIYYYIFDGETKDYFKLKMETNELSLAKELNRNDKPRHELRVGASNSKDKPEVSPESLIKIIIDVREADPKPHFEKSLYASGLSITDKIGKYLFTMTATHTEELEIIYEILYDTMKVDATLETVKKNAFLLNSKTGEMKLNFQPQQFMKGFFEFNVSATDTDEKKDEVEVKIFLISDENRISFIFKNTVEEIDGQRIFIEKTLTKYFEYEAIIDEVIKANDDGKPLDDQTEIKTHFMEDELAVDAAIIEEKKKDSVAMRAMREEFGKENLYLNDITSALNNNNNSNEKIIRILLIVLSCILAVLCIILLITYCIRIRNLNNRLKALSTTKFGSQDSGLNRIGAVVPGTNKHALEGSNPVWNEEIKAPDFDALSDISGISDLIGVEDNPHFAYKNNGLEPEDNPRKVTVYGINEHGA